MKTKASIVVLSHLSDAQILITSTSGIEREANIHINFAKYVIHHTGGNLAMEIDADQMWKSFKKTGVL